MSRNTDIVAKISEHLKLPTWWVESVIVEYLPCRRYGESGKLYTFDFGLLTDKDIDEIPEKKVVVSRKILVQNVRSNDLNAHWLLLLAGLPCATFEESGLIPEGPANSTHYPLVTNSLSVNDPKQGFWNQAIVYDSRIFYQWTVAEPYQIEGKPNLWYKSDLFDLSKLDSINNDLREYAHQAHLKSLTPKLVQQTKDKYAELENERDIIRNKIWQEHIKRKPEVTVTDTCVSKPPRLSYFDTVKLEGKRYYTKTQMAPLLLRSAVRNLHKAKEANKQIKANPNDHDALLDEIEYSAMCIINSVNCLEAYINYVIAKHLEEEFKTLEDRKRIVKKWLWVPDALNLQKCPSPLFKRFENLVASRNGIIHPDSKFDKAKGKRSHVANELNVRNAEKAVKVVKDMVESLSADNTIQLPLWIKTNLPSATYWNDVRDHLKQI